MGFKKPAIMITRADGAPVAPDACNPALPIAHNSEFCRRDLDAKSQTQKAPLPESTKSPLYFPWWFLENKTDTTSKKARYQALLAGMAGIQLYDFVIRLAEQSDSRAVHALRHQFADQWHLLRRSYTVAADGKRWALFMLEMRVDPGVQPFVSGCHMSASRLQG